MQLSAYVERRFAGARGGGVGVEARWSWIVRLSVGSGGGGVGGVGGGGERV